MLRVPLALPSPSTGWSQPWKAAPTLYVALAVLELPALSVAEQLTLWLAPMVPVLTGPQLEESTPLVASVAFALAVAFVALSRTGFGETLGFSLGSVASYLRPKEPLAVLPALSVHEPVIVLPVPSGPP
jgi:hypothetical protein